MDLSKLPKFSQTPPPPAAEGGDTAPVGQSPPPAVAGPQLYCRCGAALPAGTRFCSNCGLDYDSAVGGGGGGKGVGVGAEVWISVFLGLIFLFIFPQFAQWLYSQVNRSYQPPFLPITLTDVQTGQTTVIPYPKSVFFVEQMALFAFSVVLIVEGVVLVLSRTKGVVLFALGITVAAVLLNIWAVADGFRAARGLLLFNAVAAGFGVYIAIYQYSLLQALRHRPGRIVS